ncbi:MAG TPA: TonB-dependent receptor, partial [Croceibacterium sp.]
LGTAGADGFADYDTTKVAPVGGQFRTQEFDRARDGVSVAAQWESTDARTNITAEFIRSHSTNAWGEWTYEAAPDLSDYETYPIGCRQNANGPRVVDSNNVINPDDETPPRAQCPMGSFTNYTYDENGLFQSGYIVNTGNGWRGGSNGQFVPIGGSQYSLARRQVKDEITNADYSLRLEHEFADNLRVSVDGQYAQSEKKNLDMSVFGSLFADQELDITGDAPAVVVHKPQYLSYTWSGARPADDPLGSATEEQYFTDPRFQFWRAAMDHTEESDGEQWALAGDLEYDFAPDSFITSAKMGARYQTRDQTVRYTTYNWGKLSEVWDGSRPVNFGDVSANTARYEFPDFWRGGVDGPPGAYYYTGDLIENYDAAVDFFQGIQTTARTQFGAGGGSNWTPLAERQSVVNGTPYLPSDVQEVQQDDFAAYGMLKFDTETDGGLRLSGNIGLRYVSTDVSSASSRGPGTDQALGIAQPYSVRCQQRARPNPPGGTSTPGGICFIGQAAYEDLQDFADGSFKYEKIDHSYDYLLPSFNLKLGVTDDVLVRLAASRVMTRPENGYIRNYFVAGIDTSGNYTGSAGDPTLDPAVAWQFDLTAEWYFATVGSLTFNAFYKSIDNFFYQSVRNDTIENAAGETRDVLVRGPANYDGTGKIKGFEVAYQQTYDFLPGILAGFGTSANYTYIDSSGLPNTFLNGGNVPNNSNVPPGNLPLEQLSKHNVNVALFYEKGDVSLRAAYNWRSRFLLTASDVIIPYYSIFNEPTGQLDASIFYNVTDQIKIGIQGVNLTNEVTKTTQAYTGDPADLAPRSYFMNDRRFSFILRGNF